MKNKSCIVLVLASVFAVFASAQQPLFSAPKGGPGPVCLPGDPCGPSGSVVNVAMNTPKGGPGPMCFPGDPCFPSGSLVRAATIAPKGGTGPVCFPGDSCWPD